jgi:hypothetical protein
MARSGGVAIAAGDDIGKKDIKNSLYVFHVAIRRDLDLASGKIIHLKQYLERRAEAALAHPS